MTIPVTLVVIAKEPVPGRCKTRLCPPCTPAEAARIAAACLADTLRAVHGCAAARKLVAFRGHLDHPCLAGVEVVQQRGSGLAERLANAFDDVAGPTFLIGMDTPQISSTEIDHALSRLVDRKTQALLGPTDDGGYWGIGLRRSDRRVFTSVPMSTSHTFHDQLQRLGAMHLRTELLARMRDVDHWEDAVAVASLIPRSETAACVRALKLEEPVW